MKLSTLILIDKLLSERIGDLQIKVSNARYSRDKRMKELGIDDCVDIDDSVLTDIQNHLDACRVLLSEYVSAYNDFEDNDWK